MRPSIDAAPTMNEDRKRNMVDEYKFEESVMKEWSGSPNQGDYSRKGRGGRFKCWVGDEKCVWENE